jgi:superfamily II RNA helicase
MTLYDLIPRGERTANDVLLSQFLEYTESKRLQLYAAQEQAVLELFEENNVILNTPTGSGKSLVAAALQFKALVQGKRSIYTCPIKALVNEKWLALCHEFGAEHWRCICESGCANPVLHGRNTRQHRLARRRAGKRPGSHHG